MILLNPQRLDKDGIIFQSFEVIKTPKSIDFKAYTLEPYEVRRKFSAFPKEIRDTLLTFNQAGMLKLDAGLRARHAAQRSGKAFEDFRPQAKVRELHSCYYRLLPALATVKCYHKVRNAEGKFRTAPCTLHAAKLTLSFSLTQRSGRIIVETQVTIDGDTQPLQAFSRHGFLLEKDDNYYQLPYRDYQTLDWLDASDTRQAGNDEDAFREHVLAKLEERYPVERNGVLQEQVIDSKPESQVYVSELSGTFLMLTPQWLYEGILVEGDYTDTFTWRKDGKAFEINRHREAEDELRDFLKGQHPTFAAQRNGYFYLSFAEAAKRNWFLKTYHRMLDAGITIIGMDMLRHFRFSEHAVATGMDIRDGDHPHELLLKVTVSFGKERVPLAQLQRIVRSGQHTVLLKDDSLGVLDDQWQEKYGAVFRHGRIDGNGIRVERWMAITEQHDPSPMQLLKPVMAEDWWSLWDRWQEDNGDLFALPEGIRVEQLRPYQQRGYEWLVLLAKAGAGACLADDMGLGKTLQTICYLAHRLTVYPDTRHLVVCPASLVYNWRDELGKFAPDLRVLVHHGSSRRQQDLEAATDVIITSMGTLRSDIALFEPMLFNVVVVDESHHIKNPSALVTKAVNTLRAMTRVALSGTPIMNNTMDLYAQLSFVVPGLFGTRDFFKRTYADPIDQGGDPTRIRMLQKLTAPFVLRRTKEQVARDLPEKTEVVLWCDMSAQQQEQYEEVKRNVRNSVFLEITEQGFDRSKLSIIQGIMRLRQVCNSPLLLPAEDRFSDDSIKTDVLLDELKTNFVGHKVLVFSQFSKMLDLLATALTEAGMAYYHFDGQTPPKKRMEMVSDFQQEGNTVNVFLISLMAGNMGLNLTAADYVVLFDPWWNNAVMQQAIDRTHRIGQTRKVFAYKMVCRDTIEEKIIHLQERKRALADNLIGGEEGFVKNLSMDDLEYLLK